MKTRDSGMPDENTWQSFFDPEKILTDLDLDGSVNDVVDFGCGYGTFALAAANRIKGTVFGIDIEPEMIAACKDRASIENVHNVCFIQRDFVSEGTGLESASIDYAMMFNLLHAEDPIQLMLEAWRILKFKGRLAIMHWNYDPTTPRGPSMDIRPRPQDCLHWIINSGFTVTSDVIDLPPYHYGLVARKKETDR